MTQKRGQIHALPKYPLLDPLWDTVECRLHKTNATLKYLWEDRKLVKCSMTKTKTILLLMQEHSDMCMWLYAYRTCTNKQQDGQTHKKGVNAIKRCAELI